jgi:phosphate transport system protein
MSLHFTRDIERLKKNLLHLGGLAEKAVLASVQSLEQRNDTLANEIIASDERINDAEVEIEEECQKILALHQPVAQDLRFLITVLKLTGELERIGDCAVNIAERVLYLAAQDPVTISADFVAMGNCAQNMLHNGLDALVKMDSELAEKVVLEDETVDSMNREIYCEIQEKLKANPEQCEYLIHLLGVSRHLERIGDHATNIAEDVIYLVHGEIVRHKTEDYLSEE